MQTKVADVMAQEIKLPCLTSEPPGGRIRAEGRFMPREITVGEFTVEEECL